MNMAAWVARQRNRLVRLRNRAVLFDRKIDFAMLHDRPIVAVYPELGLIYNRVMKSGNSTLTAFLNDLAGGREYGAIADLKEDVLRPGEMSLGQMLRFRGYRSFTCVRDPHTRILSCFLHKIAAGDNPGYRAVPGFGERSSEAFARFLGHLAEGHLDDDRHWRPQVRLLYQPADRFTRICRLETLAADMAGVLRDIGRDPRAAEALAAPHRIEVAAGSKLTSASGRTAEFHDDRTRALVRRLYAEDFETFGYAP